MATASVTGSPQLRMQTNVWVSRVSHSVDDEIHAPLPCPGVAAGFHEHQLELRDAMPHDGAALRVMLQVAKPIEMGLVGEVHRFLVFVDKFYAACSPKRRAPGTVRVLLRELVGLFCSDALNIFRLELSYVELSLYRFLWRF